MDQTEEWRPVVGYEGIYEVSSDGCVRRLLKANRGVRIIKCNAHSSGYYRVDLCRDATVRHALVHRVVCMAFHGLPLPGQEVRHLNGDRKDNRAENLAWGTKKQNADDRSRHGRAMTGERHPMVKLRAVDVLAIRQVAPSVKHVEVAKEYGVSATLISDIRRGMIWRHLQEAA